MIILLTQTQLF